MLFNSIGNALVTTKPQTDLRLDFFGTTFEIPEPATFAFLSLGPTRLGVLRPLRRS